MISPHARLLRLFLLGLFAVGATVAAAQGEGIRRLQARPLQGLTVDVITLLLQGEDGGAIATRALALPIESDDAGTHLGLWIEIDGSSLQAGRSSRISLEIYVYALDAEQAIRAHLSQSFEVDLDRIDSAALESGLRFVGHLEGLAPGSYRVRVLVRQLAAQAFGLRTVRVEVAAPGSARETPLLVRESRTGWLEVRESEHGELTLDELLDVELQSLAALPVLEIGRTAEVTVSAAVAMNQLEIELESEDGTTTSFQAEAQSPAVDGRRLFRFTTPVLPPGPYRLRASSANGDVAPSVPVQIAEAEDDLQWTDLREDSERAIRFNAAEVAQQKETARKVRAVREAYREVLGVLSRGELEPAVESLAEIEIGLEEAIQDRPYDILDEAELQVVRSLSENEPEALVPLLALHLRLHRSYLEERRYKLLNHARKLVEQVAELYAETATTELARSIAADALSTLACDLQRARLRPTAVRTFQRALELDERNRLALLGFAFGQEGLGRYEEAIDALRRLVAVDPSYPEARLRLGVNLYRVGQSSESARWLRSLIDDDTPEWLLSLAYQELARIYVDSGRARATVRLLERAVSRLPRQSHLAIQLAYALDRAGDIERSTAVMRRAARAARGDGGSSPRSRYNQGLFSALEGVEDSFLTGSLARVPILARTLSEL